MPSSCRFCKPLTVAIAIMVIMPHVHGLGPASIYRCQHLQWYRDSNYSIGRGNSAAECY